MLRFFIVDWILTYLNTPELQRTPADEVLFYAALCIITIVLLGLYVAIALTLDHFKKR